MTWQLAITIQIIVASLLTMFTRRVTLFNKRVFIGVGVATYLMVVLCGFIFSIIANNGLPSLPSNTAWLYILAEGVCIPSAWLVQYKLIGYIGAGNTVTISTVNTISAALLGILFLNDGISFNFIVGAVFIIVGTAVTLRIRPDQDHHTRMPFRLILSLITAGAVLFAVGMYFEKMAINSIGAWNYSTYGWGMQFVGIVIIFILFGRKELSHINPQIIRNGLLLGLITSVSGGLYIYALSLGSLSHTVVASSGKVAITVLFAAVFLKEHNSMLYRTAAFLLCMTGLWLVVY